MLQQTPKSLVRDEYQTDHLVELTHFSSSLSSVRVFATTELWRTLLWSYPTAQKTDHFDIAQLLSELENHFSLYPINSPEYYDNPFSPQSRSPEARQFIPLSKPAWLPDAFPIDFYCHAADRVTLFLNNQPQKPKSSAAPLLPAALLLKLFQRLTQFSHVARVNDRPSFRKLVSNAQTILENHPLKNVLKPLLHRQPHRLSPPQHLTREEYRSILLEDLAQLMDLLLACEINPVIHLFMLQKLDALRSPLNELLEVTRTLLILSAAVPQQSTQLSPFNDLSSTYAALLRLHKDNPGTTPAACFPRMLRVNAAILSPLLPTNCALELEQLQQTIAVLDSISSGFAIGLSYPPQFHLYH